MRLPSNKQAAIEPAATSKLRIDLAKGVVDVEGNDELVREVYEDFKEVLLSRLSGPPEDPGPTIARLVHSDSLAAVQTPPNGSGQPSLEAVDMNLSTNSVATLLEVTNGHELVIAAMAKLMIVQGKDSCTRKEINTEMKSATDYYKQNMTKSLSAVLESHKKANRIIQISPDVYSLATGEIEALEKTLAE